MPAPLSDNNPSVPPIEDAKQGIQTFSMFYYQSLLDAGFDVSSAKHHVALLLEQQYNRFCEQGSITPKNLGTVHTKLGKVIKTLSEQAKDNPSLRSVYNDLLSIQTQMKR